MRLEFLKFGEVTNWTNTNLFFSSSGKSKWRLSDVFKNSGKVTIWTTLISRIYFSPVSSHCEQSETLWIHGKKLYSNFGDFRYFSWCYLILSFSWHLMWNSKSDFSKALSILQFGFVFHYSNNFVFVSGSGFGHCGKSWSSLRGQPMYPDDRLSIWFVAAKLTRFCGCNSCTV